VERVGFIGLGIMGSRMAANLRRAGYELTVHNRTRERAERWAGEHGATVASSPAEVGERSDVVITMVVDGPQVEALLLGPDGVAEGAAEGTLCIDMSTIAPAQTRTIGATLADRAIRFVDAPVTGSSPRAQDGTLTIMAGGDPADVERAQPLLEVMGKLVVHVGELGQGQTVKLINNAVAATNLSTLAQALIVGRAAGVDLDALVRIMGAGSGGSAMLDIKGQALLDHDYSTLFKLEHMLKDVRLCLEQGQAAGVPFPAAAQTRELLTAGMGRGLGDADFTAMLEVLEAMAGTRL
jgi:3-hydroxyisobutyrate dehydrogenase-like beta-hydroxyacid dehydrogenase